MKPLRIGLYYPWLYLTSGGERTIVEIARRSRHSVSIFTNEYQPDATFPELKSLDVRVLHRVPVKRSFAPVLLAAWRIMSQRLDLSGFDALIVVCEGLGDFATLRLRGIPAFCLCLTPLRVAFDSEYRRSYLASRGVVHGSIVRAGAATFAVVDRMAWRRYRRVFAISREVQRRIVDGRLAGPDKLQLLHPGVDLSAYTPSPSTERVFFVPGRIMWTKNLELAIDAFRLFQQRVGIEQGWRLCIAGIVDEKSRPYFEHLKMMAAGDDAIEFRVRPDDDEMRQLYRTAFATLFTAFNEDWGLVMIEAMASGKTTVAVKRGGPLEIVRHEVDGLLAEPAPGHFADAMVRLVSEPGLYDRLTANAVVSAARFGWESFVDQFDDAIENDVRAQPAAGGVKCAEPHAVRER